MSTTQPIRSKQLLHDFKDYYLTKQPNSRNYTLILIGLNTALRINDILHLTWGDVYCTEHSRFYTHLLITEKKTEKETTYLYLVTECKYDESNGVYIVVTSAQKTFTVKFSGEEGSKTAEITEVVEEEQPEESEQQPVEEQELAA